MNPAVRESVIDNKRQVVVITGAGGGIGTSIAAYFQRAGAKLALIDLRMEKLKHWMKESSADVLPIACDITSEQDVAAARDQILERFGKLDVLVNCAGILPAVTPLQDIAEEAWRKVIDINLTGTFLCTQVLGGAMLDKGGAIVNIASMAGLIPSPLRGAYSVSKAGVLMLTQLTAYEWGKRKVRANAVCPGYINTPMNAHIFENSEERRRREKLIPYWRLGTPEDVAKAVYFLASPESEYMNGEFLRVDGGFTVAAMPQIDADGRMI